MSPVGREMACGVRSRYGQVRSWASLRSSRDRPSAGPGRLTRARSVRGYSDNNTRCGLREFETPHDPTRLKRENKENEHVDGDVREVVG